MAAASRLARVITSNATNPEYSLSDLGSGFSIGETAAYIMLLGNTTTGMVEKKRVEYLFGECAKILSLASLDFANYCV